MITEMCVGAGLVIAGEILGVLICAVGLKLAEL